MEPLTDDLLLPVGARVVHIGPHKTGTTTVQFAFHAARRALAAQGVFYPGPNSQPMYAVYGVTGRMPGYVQHAPIGRWTQLVKSIRESGAARAVISSEGFCDAEDDAIRRIVDDLDPARTHIVVTLRPLASLLASQWQQSIQDGRTQGYESWLERIFREPGSSTGQAFWHRHRHHALVERWARVVGPERVTVVVVDDRDHEAVLRIFERLVGLATGTLESGHTRTNRSLTRAEIELIRALNQSFAAADVDPEIRVRFVRDGVGELLKLRKLSPDEPRITTPTWAREAADEVSSEIVEGIRALGVRVIGDLERLAPAPATAAPATAAPPAAAPSAAADPARLPDRVAAQVAAAAPLAVLIMSGLSRRRGRGWTGRRNGGADDERPWREPIRHLEVGIDSATVSTTQIRRALFGRFRRTVADRVPAAASLVRRARALRADEPARATRPEVV